MHWVSNIDWFHTSWRHKTILSYDNVNNGACHSHNDTVANLYSRNSGFNNFAVIYKLVHEKTQMIKAWLVFCVHGLISNTYIEYFRVAICPFISGYVLFFRSQFSVRSGFKKSNKYDFPYSPLLITLCLTNTVKKCGYMN